MLTFTFRLTDTERPGPVLALITGAARQHAYDNSDGDPDHQVGDLQDALEYALDLLSPDERRAAFGTPTVHDARRVIQDAMPEPELTDKPDVDALVALLTRVDAAMTSDQRRQWLRAAVETVESGAPAFDGFAAEALHGENTTQAFTFEVEDGWGVAPRSLFADRDDAAGPASERA